MQEKDRNDNTSATGNDAKEEPSVENEYGGRPEIGTLPPSTATPSIPPEMPAR